jgi:hypothetical protein
MIVIIIVIVVLVVFVLVPDRDFAFPATVPANIAVVGRGVPTTTTSVVLMRMHLIIFHP